jgi:LmbE family N-acetylglucosaminyl deacetylase
MSRDRSHMRGLRRFLVGFLGRLSRTLGSQRWTTGALRARTLVFAPHPDDEVLGCGGTIVLKVRSGAPVQVAIMTDGRTSHARLLSPQELVRIREEEARECAARLGLPSQSYRFLGFEDHALARHDAAARAQVRELIEQFRPEEIYVPHDRDLLSDHVATNTIVRSALAGYGHAVTVLEYPVWLWNTWPWTDGRDNGRVTGLQDIAALVFGCRAHIDVRSAATVKAHALAAYRSQLERRDGNPDWPVLGDVSSGEFLARFAGDREIFRRSHYRP